MARDDSAKAKKKRWADWVNAGLAQRNWTAADLVEASGGFLVYNTVYNWTKAMARAEAEAAVMVAAAFKVTASEALEAASYPILAKVMEGKELRFDGAPPTAPDPGLMKILAAKDLTDEIKAIMIKWWADRVAEDEERRIRDAQKIIEMRRESA